MKPARGVINRSLNKFQSLRRVSLIFFEMLMSLSTLSLLQQIRK